MFNDSFIRACGEVYLLVSLGEENKKRIMNFSLFVISCENVYNSILDRLLLEALDNVASFVHIKINYHNDYGSLVVVKVVDHVEYSR